MISIKVNKHSEDRKLLYSHHERHIEEFVHTMRQFVELLNWSKVKVRR